MCSIDFSPFSFTWVSSRKDGYGRTEKLCLLTGMRGPSSGGCDRPVDWPTASLHVGFIKTFVCGWGRVWHHLWALVGTLGRLCHRWVLPKFVLKWCESGWGGLTVGLCGPEGVSWESWAWGSMRNEGSMLVTLTFNGGALSCIVTALLSLHTHPWATFWRASGGFSDQWDTTGQQWPHCTSVPPAWLCAPNPPGIPFLPPAFLLNSEWMNPLLFFASFASSLPLACSHCAAEYFLFTLLSGGSSLK